MHLTHLKLWNFRKYGSGNQPNLDRPDLTVPFGHGINVLIGENDSGKTAIIDAIKIVLKTHSGEWINLEENDFSGAATKLRIECVFGGFTEPEASNFTEWLSWDGPIPSLKVFVDVERVDNRIIPFDIKAGLDPDGTSLNARAKDFLRTTYLRPLRDAKSELIPRRNSRLSQILRAHSAFKTDPNNHHLVQEFIKFNETIEKYFEGKDANNTALADQLGKQLKDDIDGYLKAFNKMTSLIVVSEADIKQILERLELTIGDSKNLGLGSHNILFIAAELLHLNKSEWQGLRLGLIEEIEAHLHPQIQLQVIETLQKIESIQLIVTTHSPNIGSKVDLEKLIICNQRDVFPMGSTYTHLRQTDYQYLKRFLDVTKANLFFSKGLILVEGWAEELLLPALAKTIGINLTEKGVSIINLGNTAFLRYSAIFKRTDGKELDLPVSLITDLDVLPDSEAEVIPPATETRKFLKAKGKQSKYDGGKVKTFVSPHWTLEYCIALSPHLRQHFFNAIVMAGDEMTLDGYTGKKVTEDWETFSGVKSSETIAFEMYTGFIKNGKAISKSIIAQNFASILDSLPNETFDIGALKTDESLQYLFNAITYASRLE